MIRQRNAYRLPPPGLHRASAPLSKSAGAPHDRRAEFDSWPERAQWRRVAGPRAPAAASAAGMSAAHVECAAPPSGGRGRSPAGSRSDPVNSWRMRAERARATGALFGGGVLSFFFFADVVQ